MKRIRHNDSGQLAVGLALSFIGVMAVFLLVFQSSSITREKMKLQQTTDFAALVAADWQRRYLNRIQELNESIEDAFEATQELLAVPPCPTHIFPSGNHLPNVQARTSVAISVDFGDEDDSSVDPCDRACGKYDNFIYRRIIDAYKAERSRLAGEAQNIIANVNARSAESIEETFSEPRNLPFGLQHLLREEHGSSLSKGLIRTMLRSGQLDEHLEVRPDSESLPLFFSKDQDRTFAYSRTRYGTTPLPSQICIIRGATPKTTIVSEKIVRASNFETSYVVSATYTPPTPTLAQRLRAFIRESNPAANTFGKPVKDADGKDARVFRDRAPMQTLSLAGPYGGDYPEEGNIATGGHSGSQFEGARLLGIAETDTPNAADYSIPDRYRKEFLH